MTKEHINIINSHMLDEKALVCLTDNSDKDYYTLKINKKSLFKGILDAGSKEAFYPNWDEVLNVVVIDIINDINKGKGTK